MKVFDLFESPIGNWEVDPDFFPNRVAQSRNGHGYERERSHYGKADYKALRNPKTIERIRAGFLKCPYRFNIYWWHNTEYDYDPHLQKGAVSPEWLQEVLGEDATRRILSQPGFEQSINVVMTNNLSDEHWRSIRSPWMIGHRISHTLASGEGDAIQFEQAHDFTYACEAMVSRILMVGYGISEDPNWGHRDYDPYHNIHLEFWAEVLGHSIGTMASARQGKLVNRFEWYHEMFAQYLLTGAIPLKPLPPTLTIGQHSLVLSDQPERRLVAQKSWARLPRVAERTIRGLLAAAVGHVFVM